MGYYGKIDTRSKNRNALPFPLKIVIASWLLGYLTISAAPLFCSSHCASDTRSCLNATREGCLACADKLYILEPIWGVGCTILDQTQVFSSLFQRFHNQILFYDLVNPIDLTDFKTNLPVPSSCSTYQISGKYGAGHYLSKTYLTPAPHWQVRVRFTIVYMGTWLPGDSLSLSIDGSINTWEYSCWRTYNLCTSTDCMVILEYSLNHTDPLVTINFTSSITNPANVQSWGVKELIVAIKDCHASCSSCFGPLESECLVCQDSYYLLGNSCVKVCPKMIAANQKTCLDFCPIGYFAKGKHCEPCGAECRICNGPSDKDCLISVTVSQRNQFEANQEFWILVIIVGICGLGFAIYCMYQKKITEQRPVAQQTVVNEHDNPANNASIQEEGEGELQRQQDIQVHFDINNQQVNLGEPEASQVQLKNIDDDMILYQV